MPTITDVSPTSAPSTGHSVTGRMLSLACTPDGQTVYLGSYANLWASDDAGQNFAQLTWPQPPPDQFDAPGSLGGWCAVDIATALGWRVDKHPRVVVPLKRGGPPSIVGFGDCGVWTAVGNGAGAFAPPNVVIADFGPQAGGWQVDQHPRFVADLSGTGRADIVGFGDAGVWTAIGNGDGTFQAPRYVLANFGYQQGWRVETHPRFLAVLTSSGRADIVGFGDAGVWTALSNGDGTFQDPKYVLANFGAQQGWRVDRHPRLVVSLTGSGRADIVGFGDAGVWTALGNGDGTFQEGKFVLANFGYEAGGWRVESHPRLLAHLTSSGHADIVGFGNAGVWTALGNGDGTFQEGKFVLANFGLEAGGWQVEQHPRLLANLTNSGHADIVGFGTAGVWTAIGNGDGTFKDARYVLANFGLDQGWRPDRHPRLVVSLTPSGRADLVGFGDAGVWTAIGDGQGGFPASNYVLANFGYGTTVLALMANDLAAGSRGIWRSTDWGSNWTQVYKATTGMALGQLQWALGSDHLVYAATGPSLAISRNGGTTFQDVFPWGANPAKRVNHVAVWQNAPADPAPAVIYALGDSTMFLSFDGGATWMEDKGTLPASVGGIAGITANFNSPTVFVISPRFPLEVFVIGNGSGAGQAARLFRGDYTQFPFGSHQSSWDPVPVPDIAANPSTQDSGNVFLATTQKGRGDLLFLGAQRRVAFVGPLYPNSGADWHTLDSNIHIDLHGLLLSPDFRAAITNGTYHPGAGTIWLLSDGGIYRSTNGGTQFNVSSGVRTLSCVNVAAVALPGQGPALSLNTGDNDGFFSKDGGATWVYQQYGGGDNDCSYADPLRPHSLLVLTPRWNLQGTTADSTRDSQTVAVYETSPGHLPNAAANTGDRHIIPGPPLLPESETFHDLWNASSGYGSRGSRPIVPGLSGEAAPAQGDYIFILNPTIQPVLVRTQNILNIESRDEWVTTATGPGQGAHVFLQGPPLPNAGLGVVQAAGGHAATVFYVGGDGGLTLWTWRAGAPAWTKIVPAAATPGVSDGATFAVRFFVSPYQPNLIYILDANHVKRSDDGGQTWHVDVNLETQLTWSRKIAFSTNDNTSSVGDHFDLILTDMQFDPSNPRRRFAVGLGGAFMTDDGVNWVRLLHTGALAGRPANCCYDPVSNPSDPALYVAFAGRSVVKISRLP